MAKERFFSEPEVDERMKATHSHFRKTDQQQQQGAGSSGQQEGIHLVMVDIIQFVREFSRRRHKTDERRQHIFSAFFKLRGYFMKPHNGAGDQLRKEGDIEQQAPGLFQRGHPPLEHPPHSSASER